MRVQGRSPGTIPDGFRLIVILGFLAIVLCSPISVAADLEGETIAGHRHVHIRVANDGGARFDLFGNDTYYVKFDGGGLNALHITTNPLEAFGQVTRTRAANGTFYISDTGGRGFFDDLVLAVAVQEPVPPDFAVRIRSSGYAWRPPAELNRPPVASELVFLDPALDETFTSSDFRYGPQSWNPSGTEGYPLMAGVDPTAGQAAFRLIFVDLSTGILGLNSELADLDQNGTTRVDYILTNTTSPVSFNVYGWNNQSNQGRGISWTNRVSGEGSSGFIVMEGPDTGSATGDSAIEDPGQVFPDTGVSLPPEPAPSGSVVEQIVSAIVSFLQSLGLIGSSGLGEI